MLRLSPLKCLECWLGGGGTCGLDIAGSRWYRSWVVVVAEQPPSLLVERHCRVDVCERPRFEAEARVGEEAADPRVSLRDVPTQVGEAVLVHAENGVGLAEEFESPDGNQIDALDVDPARLGLGHRARL